MSRLGGGIGTRGPGETQLETDRRRIQDRVAKLEQELRDLDRARATRSKARRRAQLPLVSIVGYTNAGKSTLFNRLTEADVLVEDRLFATLDSTVRKLDLPTGQQAVMSDTVGFVRRLPHELVEAFRSTLDEVGGADLLIHLVDASDESPSRQIESVRTVLAEIGADEIPELLVFNKADAAGRVATARLLELHPGSLAISARDGTGLDTLIDEIADGIRANTVEMELVVPYQRGDIIAAVHRVGEVHSQEHADDQVVLKASIPASEAYHFEEWLAGGAERDASD